MTPNERKRQISACLETAFSTYGFTQPNVSMLREITQTTLKTLYKYFPSKEDMIVAALTHRHERYLAFLEEGCPTVQNTLEAQSQAIYHVFHRLALWLTQYAPTGCMSLQALSSYPNNEIISNAVTAHKADVRRWLTQLTQNAALADTLYLLHEGMSAAWPTLHDTALDITLSTLKTTLSNFGLPCSN